MRALTLVISIAATAVVLTACGKANGEDKGGKGGFPPAPVSVQEVKTTYSSMRFEYVGQTAGSKEAEVRARVQGILEKRTYQEGSKINAGQTLFILDSRPYAAQVQAAEADLARAQAQYSQAKRNFDRVKPLAGSNALSQREFDEATSGEESGAAADQASAGQADRSTFEPWLHARHGARDRLGKPCTKVGRLAGFAGSGQLVDDSLAARSPLCELQRVGSRAPAIEQADRAAAR